MSSLMKSDKICALKGVVLCLFGVEKGFIIRVTINHY